MNAPNSLEPKTIHASTKGDAIGLVELLIAFARRKLLVIGLPVLFAVCAALGSLVMPDIYKASTKILPSQQNQSSAAAMLNRLGGFAGSAPPGALSIRIPVELYVSMLKSNTIADNLIKRFDLGNAYGEDILEMTRKVLERNTRIKAGRDGLITIDVEDKDPKRAAQIANGYVEELFKLVKKMALTEASHRRLFYERRLQFAKDRLVEAAVNLKIQSHTGDAVRVDRQNRSVVESVARLRAQITAKEIQLEVMEAFVTIHNQEYNRGQQELGAMRAELNKLESNGFTMQGPGMQSKKQAGSDNVSVFHDLQYYESLYEMLAKQYEIARLDEANDTSVIEILDKAVEPERKIKPRREIIVVGSALFGLLLAIFGILIFDVIRIGQRFEESEQWNKLKNNLRFK